MSTATYPAPLMPFPVLCFVLIVTTVVTGDTAAVPTGDLPLEVRIEHHLDSLQSDSPTTRQRARHELLQLANDTDSSQREGMIQSLLRYSLWSDLETQLSVDRLVDEIKTLTYQENLERLLRSSPPEAQPKSALQESWEVFAARANQDADARDAFRQIALRAGPSLHWRQLHGRLPATELDIVLISHLGCLAPHTPRLFDQQSRAVFAQLTKIPLQSNLPTLAEAKGRVIGRLIDRTLVDNPYGWTIPQRLHLALAYQRDQTTARISSEVLGSDQPLARDLATAMLAWRRMVSLSGERESRSAAEAQRVLIAALNDRRVVCVSPERLVAARPLAENQEKNQCIHRGAIIRTRVQDVAGWVLIQDSEIDAREAGLSNLRGDPVWGTELASIGFASEQLRERFQHRVAALLRAQPNRP